MDSPRAGLTLAEALAMCEKERTRCDREIEKIRERTRPDLTAGQEYQNRLAQEALDRIEASPGYTFPRPMGVAEQIFVDSAETYLSPTPIDRDAPVEGGYQTTPNPKVREAVREFADGIYGKSYVENGTAFFPPQPSWVDHVNGPPPLTPADKRARANRPWTADEELLAPPDEVFDEPYPVKQMGTRDHFDQAAWEDDDSVLAEDLPPIAPGYVPGPGDGGLAALHTLQQEDMVNSPSHYTQGATEIIDQIRQSLGHDGFVAFCIGNVIKYANRARFKGNLAQDMAKAAWYARMAAGDDPRKS